MGDRGAFGRWIAWSFRWIAGVFAFIWTRDSSLRTELKTEITNLRTNELADLKSSVSEVRADVSGQGADLKNEIDKVGERVGGLSRDTNSRIDSMQITFQGGSTAWTSASNQALATSQAV